jgi:protein O-GlcNAc transferase
VADAGIYLLTDTAEAVEIFRSKYGSKIVFRDMIRIRSGDNTELHYSAGIDRYQQAKDVLTDVYLAMRCDFFIGDGTSNVSCAVVNLKEWNGRAKLHGRNIVTISNRRNWIFP